MTETTPRSASAVGTPTGATAPVDLLAQVLGETPPSSFALLARAGRGTLEVLAGPVVDVDLLADIPLEGTDGPRQVLALVPFRQVAERGYERHDDGAPLRCLVVERSEAVPLAGATERLPADLPHVTGLGFDVSDEDYVATVRSVIEDEIGRGEGANFVIRRDYLARADASGRDLALAVLRRLLDGETGAYWTFAVVTPGVILVGASPERHVSVQDGVATMNPISGTFRHPAGGVDPAEFSRFLMDTKEVEELFMVVDEELKMMSAVCTSGGVVEGPFLKQMSRVTHTEYLLSGRSELDVRDVLRETMFAPTVTGSPMQNACAVIKRHERGGRGYYSGVAALMTPEADGRFSLDAPILIRTAQVDDDGGLRVSAGATLVRHSTPEGEVAETAGKAAGLLGALGLEAAFAAGFGRGQEAVDPETVDDVTSSASAVVPRGGLDTLAGARYSTGEEGAASSLVEQGRQARVETPVLADDPEIRAALAARNEMLAPFWLSSQVPEPVPALAGRTVVVVDAEDRFTTMLAHQLRHLGMVVTVVPWTAVSLDGSVPVPEGADRLDLVVSGPGPGDPRTEGDPRIERLRAVVRRRLAAHEPLVAVCLSHQVLCHELGLPLERLDRPRQGVQLTVDLFGEPVRLGFYNTYTARLPLVTPLPDGVAAAADASTGDVFALRGPGFATIQGHAESILSVDGLTALERLATHALASRASQGS